MASWGSQLAVSVKYKPKLCRVDIRSDQTLPAAGKLCTLQLTVVRLPDLGKS